MDATEPADQDAATRETEFCQDRTCQTITDELTCNMYDDSPTTESTSHMNPLPPPQKTPPFHPLNLCNTPTH